MKKRNNVCDFSDVSKRLNAYDLEIDTLKKSLSELNNNIDWEISELGDKVEEIIDEKLSDIERRINDKIEKEMKKIFASVNVSKEPWSKKIAKSIK